MSLKKNIIANYMGMGAVALVPIFALPCYLSALGAKQFGLIGFIVLLQALLGLLDAGMSQVLVREISILFSSIDNGRCKTASLLFGFERIYWLFAFCACCITLLLADEIALYWLKTDGLPSELGIYAIYGAAAIFATQFPGSIYRSLLIGVQAQVTLNCIMFGSVLLRHVGGVIVVSLWPSLTTYLIWHVSMALLETLVRGYFAWKILDVKRSQEQWEPQALTQIWRLVVGTSGAVWLGALTVQMDKIVLSRTVTIEQFGYYTIAATVATGLLQLIYPLLQAILPRIVQLRSDPIALRKLNIRLFSWISLVAVLSALLFIFTGEWLLNIWLKNPNAVVIIYPLLSILLVGTALNAFYNVGYINWIAHAKVRRLLQVNAVSLLLSVSIIPPLVSWKGTMGAAFGWLSINLIGLIVSLEWLKRK